MRKKWKIGAGAIGLILIPLPVIALSPSDTHLMATGSAVSGCWHLRDFETISSGFLKLSKAQQVSQGKNIWKLESEALQKAEENWNTSLQYEPNNATWKILASNGRIFMQVKPPPGGFGKFHAALTNTCKKLRNSTGT